MVNVAKGESEYQDMDLGEIQELRNTTLETLAEDNLMKMSASKPMPDEEEKDIEKTGSERKRNPDTRKSTSFMI